MRLWWLLAILFLLVHHGECHFDLSNNGTTLPSDIEESDYNIEDSPNHTAQHSDVEASSPDATTPSDVEDYEQEITKTMDTTNDDIATTAKPLDADVVETEDTEQYTYLFEGDILRYNESTLNGSLHSALKNVNFHWPNAEVDYVFSGQFNGREKQMIREAMKEMEAKTCVRFFENRNRYNRIRFVKGNGCASFVGRQTGEQDIWISDGCFHRGIILHEIMHALGFVHEQNRADRDNYVEILWQNIQSGMEHNFKRRSKEDLTLMDTPYSFESIMHYHLNAFGIWGRATIRPKVAANNVGGGNGLSEIDRSRINRLYKCKNTGGNGGGSRGKGGRDQETSYWQQGYRGHFYSFGCTFEGTKLAQYVAPAEFCGIACYHHPYCTHFSWSPFMGGLCTLKSGIGRHDKPRCASGVHLCGYWYDNATGGEAKCR